MELWGWLVGYVILFALLHLLLYFFYARRSDENGSPRQSFADSNGPNAGSRYSSSADGYRSRTDDFETDAVPEFDGETVRCPHCGTRNEADQAFTYCWNCISSLRR